MKSTSLVAGALVVASQLLGGLAVKPSPVLAVPDLTKRQDKPSQTPSQIPAPGQPRSQGCWSSNANMTISSEIVGGIVSSGECREYCLKKKFSVMALKSDNCFCGYAMPADKYKAKDSKCDFGCPSYPLEACGNLGNPAFYSIFNLGRNIDPPIYSEDDKDDDDDHDNDKGKDDKKKSSSSTAAAGPTNTDKPSAPEQSAEESEGSDEDEGGDDGPNVAGIVAGSVVGVLAVVGGAIGIWFFMRRRRNSEIEEEHRRNAAVNAFISGSKPPSSSGSISMTDSRLDPVMAHRRMSDGSIADDQDYSRKILRVTNA